MADVRDLIYHGVREQVRTVLVALGPERIEKGLTAFEDGASNWADCFFARAVGNECNLQRGDPEQTLQRLLGLPSHMPIRITYNLFDEHAKMRGMQGISLSKKELRQFIRAFVDKPQDAAMEVAINQLIASTQSHEMKEMQPTCI